MGQQPKIPIIMSFNKSFKENNERCCLKTIAKEFGLAIEQVEKDLQSYLEYQENSNKRNAKLN